MASCYPRIKGAFLCRVNAVPDLTSLLESVMIVLMALLVGIIVIALFLPIIRIIQLMT